MGINLGKLKTKNKKRLTIVFPQNVTKMKKILLIYLKLFQMANQCLDKVFQLRLMENSMSKVYLSKLETFTPKVHPKSQDLVKRIT
jgi:hypothetical protein